MAGNKTKTDRIHDQMPRFFKTRVNPNWKALIEALGESDQNLADLVEEVRKQFFIKSASRPYIDRLGANVRVSRPRLIGMDDPTFRAYVPVLAYQPKQVKAIIDDLLNIFFFRETTTAFTQSIQPETYTLVNGWELIYKVDQIKEERIDFRSDEFIDISNATAEEVVSAINRQVQNSFAIVLDDRIKRQKFIRIFSNTIGSKGSIQITGGRANMALQFSGFKEDLGSGSNTEWTITKIGDTAKFKHTGGVSPVISGIVTGDVVISSIPGNQGSFVIESVNLGDSSFTVTNLFATPGVYDHSTLDATEMVRFMSPDKMVIYTNNSRSLVWEVTPGEIIVEMPATPPVVKRSLIGSAHVNGMVEIVTNVSSASSLDIEDGSEWPTSGEFIIQEKNEIQTHILTGSEDTIITKNFNTRFDKANRYSFTSRTGNSLGGITPNLPAVSSVLEKSISNIVRTTDIITVSLTSSHDFKVGEVVRIEGVTPDTDGTINGTFIIRSVPNNTVFTYRSLGVPMATNNGIAMVERIGMANSGSFAYLTSAQNNTGILGPYMWSATAPYVISSLTSKIQANIKAGNNVRSIEILAGNNIPDAEGFVIFDFGTEREEGPVRYLYKPTSSSLQLDPAYIFKNNHDVSSSITVIRRRGAHVMSGLGKEYPLYITDPAIARETLQDLIKKVKSVGIFIDFLVRYPEQLYAALDVYKSDNENLWPIGTQ